MLQVLVAVIAGSIVGFERELAGKRAGLRTHAVVAAGSALAVGIGELVVTRYGEGDPTRVFHAVITGIGFIGAGAILHTKTSSAGLTTAATVFLVAVLGAVSAFGAPVLALLGSVLALLMLRGLHILERPVQRAVNRMNRHEPVPVHEQDDLD